LGQIGSGGFAEVRKVRNLLDERVYAAKIIKIKPSFDRNDTEDKLNRFLSEPKAHAHLSHPNILQYHGCWVEFEHYSELEKAEMLEEEQQTEPEFEMILLNESHSSDGIVFGSSSSIEPQPETFQQ
jgi:serine/threonine protein kinase